MKPFQIITMKLNMIKSHQACTEPVQDQSNRDTNGDNSIVVKVSNTLNLNSVPMFGYTQLYVCLGKDVVEAAFLSMTGLKTTYEVIMKVDGLTPEEPVSTIQVRFVYAAESEQFGFRVLITAEEDDVCYMMSDSMFDKCGEPCTGARRTESHYLTTSCDLEANSRSGKLVGLLAVMDAKRGTYGDGSATMAKFIEVQNFWVRDTGAPLLVARTNETRQGSNINMVKKLSTIPTWKFWLWNLHVLAWQDCQTHPSPEELMLEGRILELQMINKVGLLMKNADG